ncbi:cubilin-like [Littorina saxatilis]|uniref:cubilin-like n=1 Tax=Littorina saxatilis TaxID=31220 RepID=UPI0038B55D5A
MTLVFQAMDNDYTRYTGFSAVYLVQGRECSSHDVTGSEGDLGLPDYQHDDEWPHGVCTWNITVSPDHLVQLTIDELYSYTYQSVDVNCNTSYLQVSQMTAGVETTLAKLCFDESPWLVRSTANSMTVRLVLGEEGGRNRVRFTARYKAVPPEQVITCGGQLTAMTGLLTSPNFPGNYSNQMECQWLITVDPAFTLQLDVYMIDIERPGHTGYNGYYGYFTEQCSQDSVQIRDGDSLLSPLLGGPWCGQHQYNDGYSGYYGYSDFMYPWRTTNSTGNTVLVKFVTNEQDSGQGFNITWSALCDRSITDTEGTLQSPNFPQAYPDNTDCSFRFEDSNASLAVGYSALEAGFYYVITFTAFDLEPEVNGSCVNDYIEIAENWHYTTPYSERTEPRRYCGNQIPDPVSVYAAAEIRFVSNNHTSAGGFRLNYRREQAECGPSLLTSSEGIVSSPGYPYSYPSDTNCTWTIRVAETENITLFFTHIRLGNYHSNSGDGCFSSTSGAVLSVYDGDSLQNDSTRLGVLCGTYYYGPRLSSTGNTMTLVFEAKDNDYTRFTGFSAVYLVLGRECSSQDVTGPEGDLGLPDYQHDDEWPHGVCTWNITVSPDHLVQLTIDELYSYTYQSVDVNCNTSYLQVSQMTAGVETILAKLCFDESPWLVRSTANSMTVRLVLGEEGGSTRVRFTARYKAVPPEQVITCGGQLTAMTGLLTSPNFPGNYSNQMECQWLITVDPAFTLQLDVYMIDIERPGHTGYNGFYGYFTEQCSKDSVQIRDGDSLLSPLLGGPWCGQHQYYDGYSGYGYSDVMYPWRTTNSTGNTVLIKFVSNAQDSGQGFNITWSALCDSSITDTEGTLQSPNFPQAYPDNTDCSFSFEDSNASLAVGYSALEAGYYYVITFTAFDLEPEVNGSCVNDYIEIAENWHYTTPYSERTEPRRYCGNQIPDPVSVYTAADIRFVSNNHTSAGGFHLNYRKVQAECGPSLLTSSEGIVSSPGYPYSYPSDTNCTWTIRVAETENITLFFTHTTLGSYQHHYSDDECLTRTSGAVLSVYDGESVQNDSTRLGV